VTISETASGREQRSDPTNPVVKVLDRLFLWIPRECAPGLAAVCLFLLRQIVLSTVLMLTAFAALAMAFSGANLMESFSKIPGWSIQIAISMSFGIVQELGRYSFVRHADRQIRSLIIFTITTTTFVLIAFHDDLYTVIWATVDQAAASVVMFYGLRFKRHIAIVIGAIVACHVVVYTMAPQIPKSLGIAPKTSQQTDSTAPTAPAVGDMKSWAKLYPGAVITKSSIDRMLGLTNWQVEYSVPASPDQIASFYETIARQRGFTDTQNLGGWHVFRQDSSNNDFSYSAIPAAKGSDVIFKARTFGQPG
jgi:hypothetical protein